MSVYQVNRFLRDVNRSATLAGQCEQDIDGVLNNYQLTLEESAALKRWEVRKLYDMGANPLLLLVYSLATNKDMAAYARAINQKG